MANFHLVELPHEEHYTHAIWNDHHQQKLEDMAQSYYPIYVEIDRSAFRITNGFHKLSFPFTWFPDPYLRLSHNPQYIYESIVRELKGQTIPEEVHHGERQPEAQAGDRS